MYKNWISSQLRLHILHQCAHLIGKIRIPCPPPSTYLGQFYRYNLNPQNKPGIFSPQHVIHYATRGYSLKVSKLWINNVVPLEKETKSSQSLEKEEHIYTTVQKMA